MTQKTQTQQKHTDNKNRLTPQLLNESYYYMLRGHKRTISQTNKTKLLKTKHLLQKQQKSLRYDYIDSEIEQSDKLNEQFSQKKRTQYKLDNFKLSLNIQRRAKSQFQIIKSSPTQKLQKLHRNFSINDDKFMITTSRMELTSQQQNRRKHQMMMIKRQQQKRQTQQVTTKFHSRNLHERMNEYLNLVVAKSSQDHQDMLRKIKENQEQCLNEIRAMNKERENKIFVKNKFLRELKFRIGKKNQLNEQGEVEGGNECLKAITARTDINTKNHGEHMKNTSRMSSKAAIQNGEQLISIAIKALSKSMRINSKFKNQRLNTNNNKQMRPLIHYSTDRKNDDLTFN